jgi:hypothetical protein
MPLDAARARCRPSGTFTLFYSHWPRALDLDAGSAVPTTLTIVAAPKQRNTELGRRTGSQYDRRPQDQRDRRCTQLGAGPPTIGLVNSPISVTKSGSALHYWIETAITARYRSRSQLPTGGHPRVGTIAASTIAATIANPGEFRSACHLAAFLGLRPTTCGATSLLELQQSAPSVSDL